MFLQAIGVLIGFCQERLITNQSYHLQRKVPHSRCCSALKFNILAHPLRANKHDKAGRRGLGSPHAILDYTLAQTRALKEESSTVPRPMNSACSSTRDPHPRLSRFTRISAYFRGLLRRVSSWKYCLLPPRKGRRWRFNPVSGRHIQKS
jgi:hypothetical protein